MHGEYKTPGGKLVMADLDVREGRLKDVEVSGDFFLEPPEALSGITGALEDAPAKLAEEYLAERIRDAVGSDVERIGFSAEELARTKYGTRSGSTPYPDPAGSSSPASPATARKGGTDCSRGDSHRRSGRDLFRERIWHRWW